MVTGVGTRVCHQHNFSLMGLVTRDWPCVRLSLYCVALSSLRRRALSRDRWLAGGQATDSQGDGGQSVVTDLQGVG